MTREQRTPHSRLPNAATRGNRLHRLTILAVAPALVFGALLTANQSGAQSSDPSLAAALYQGTCKKPGDQPLAAAFPLAAPNGTETGSKPAGALDTGTASYGVAFDALMSQENLVLVIQETGTDAAKKVTNVACGEVGGVPVDGSLDIALRPLAKSDYAGLASFKGDANKVDIDVAVFNKLDALTKAAKDGNDSVAQKASKKAAKAATGGNAGKTAKVKTGGRGGGGGGGGAGVAAGAIRQTGAAQGGNTDDSSVADKAARKAARQAAKNAAGTPVADGSTTSPTTGTGATGTPTGEITVIGGLDSGNGTATDEQQATADSTPANGETTTGTTDTSGAGTTTGDTTTGGATDGTLDLGNGQSTDTTTGDTGTTTDGATGDTTTTTGESSDSSQPADTTGTGTEDQSQLAPITVDNSTVEGSTTGTEGTDTTATDTTGDGTTGTVDQQQIVVPAVQPADAGATTSNNEGTIVIGGQDQSGGDGSTSDGSTGDGSTAPSQ